MRVLFDAFWWVRGPVSNQAILHDLVHTWLELYPGDEVVLATRHEHVDQLAEAFNHTVRVEALRLSPHGIAVMFELPLIARRVRPDVIITHNFTPLAGRSVVFIQDLLFVEHPDWFTRKERIYFGLMPVSAPRAAAILASSDDQGDAIRSVVRRARRVTSVGLGLGLDLLGVRQAEPPDARLIPGSFLLTVGRLNVRKNLEFTCLSAVRSGRLTSEVPLVVVGSPNGVTTRFPTEVRAAIDSGQILLLGHISTAELAWLYANTSLFLFMSLGEGFGLPPVEALAFGARVVASDIPVMREVLDDHAEFADPRDISALAATIGDILDRPQVAGEREMRIRSARETHSWNRTTAAIRSVIEALP